MAAPANPLSGVRILIPSRGRPALWAKTLKKMPFLNTPATILGLEEGEADAYWAAAPDMHCNVRTYLNPRGSVAVAREHLRSYAASLKGVEWAVVTDDNASFKEESLHALVGCAREWHRLGMGTALIAGMHNTAPHFDRRAIASSKLTVGGFTTYATVAMIFQIYPMSLYSNYAYPPDAYGLDDRHFYLWALSQGVTRFRVCMDAPFNKSRYQEGGQGPITDRMTKCGHAIACLARDFPQYVGATGTLRIPWQFLIQMETSGDGFTPNRLVGGAMRKETDLSRPAGNTRKKLTITRTQGARKS